MYTCRYTMAPTSYGQPHLLYSHKGIAPYQHTFKDRKEPALPLQHEQKCRRTPPKLGRVRRHSHIQFMVAGRRMRLAVRACKGGLRQRCTAAVRHTLPPRLRREPALAELGHPEGASGRCSLTALHRSRSPYMYAPRADSFAASSSA